MKCDRAVCIQACTRQCSMSCLSSVTTGNCQQTCSSGTCESMTCDSTNCTQNTIDGESDMECPAGVKRCKQVGVRGNVTMRCDGDVCEQGCLTGNCDMTCSASVKECHQTCVSGGKCLHRCDAANCKLDCMSDSSCTNVKRSDSAPLEKGLFISGVILVLIFDMLIT